MILRFRWISGILELSNVIAGFRHYQSWKLKFETNLMQNLVRLSHKFHCHQIWNIVSSLGRCAMQKYNNTKYRNTKKQRQLCNFLRILQLWFLMFPFLSLVWYWRAPLKTISRKQAPDSWGSSRGIGVRKKQIETRVVFERSWT